MKIQRKKELLSLLDSTEIEQRILALCGDELKKEELKANLLNIALDDNLSKCSIISIVKCALDIANLKLSLNRKLGIVYIVPRKCKNGDSYSIEARVDIGYRGWLELARRNNITIKSHTVFKCDDFQYSLTDSKEHFNLIPNFDERQDYDSKWVKENLRGVVVIIEDKQSSSIKFVSSGILFKIMQNNESVKNNRFSAYSEWLNEMMLAKAIKYCLSKMSFSDYFSEAIRMDNLDEQHFSNHVTTKQNNINNLILSANKELGV